MLFLFIVCLGWNQKTIKNVFLSSSEVAFGYKGLQIQLYCSAGNLSTLFKVKYTARVTDKFECVEVKNGLQSTIIVKTSLGFFTYLDSRIIKIKDEIAMWPCVVVKTPEGCNFIITV